MGTCDTLDWVCDNFEAFEKELNGQKESAIHSVRREALSRFSEMGLPTAKDEAWKHTNLQSLKKERFALPKVGVSVAEADCEPYWVPDAKGPRLVFVNGTYAPELSRTVDLPKGVHVLSLREALAADSSSPEGKLIEQYLAQVANYKSEAFVALNTAFVKDGALIYAPKGVAVPEPVELLFISKADGSSLVSHPRVLIVAEESSSVSVVETYAGEDERTYLTSAVSEIVVRENAQVDHYRVQREGTKAAHVSVVEIQQDANSVCNTHCYSFGGNLVRNDVNPSLNGENINAGLYGLTVLKDQQHVDNHTVIDHAKPNCESNELYKGIYAGKSKGVFNGTIIVRQDAQKTNAIQSNQSILLSDDATSTSQPQLKIWADDVRCTHGATIGQLDEDALFYLRARGIPQEQAKHLLIQAFAGEVLEAVTHEGLQSVLSGLLLEKLESLI